ncbi:hypothetical protein EC957_004510 [Mortierella hygrophila]|uniref:Uncharacterized protein n=1 Tax=Mortierella hygrophila TaxID=979708 RepID=A0A9P6K6Z2_9FUNG|nr:hypothetical protein EC957_004510 [Mortierella hygrophila]
MSTPAGSKFFSVPELVDNSAPSCAHTALPSYSGRVKVSTATRSMTKSALGYTASQIHQFFEVLPGSGNLGWPLSSGRCSSRDYGQDDSRDAASTPPSWAVGL